MSRVTPALDGVRVDVEIPDSAILIPRNSLIEANQTGLISEALIDIYPKNPLPEPLYGPLDADCKSEGLLVCNGDEVKRRSELLCSLIKSEQCPIVISSLQCIERIQQQ